MKSDKVLYIIYVDIESLITKIDGYANNPTKSPAIKIGEHIPCGYSMSTIWGFDHIEDKHTLYIRIKITSKCKSMFHLYKKNPKKVC